MKAGRDSLHEAKVHAEAEEKSDSVKSYAKGNLKRITKTNQEKKKVHFSTEDLEFGDSQAAHPIRNVIPKGMKHGEMAYLSRLERIDCGFDRIPRRTCKKRGEDNPQWSSSK